MSDPFHNVGRPFFTKQCSREGCNAPRNMTGLCPAHARQAARTPEQVQAAKDRRKAYEGGRGRNRHALAMRTDPEKRRAGWRVSRRKQYWASKEVTA